MRPQFKATQRRRAPTPYEYRDIGGNLTEIGAKLMELGARLSTGHPTASKTAITKDIHALDMRLRALKSRSEGGWELTDYGRELARIAAD